MKVKSIVLLVVIIISVLAMETVSHRMDHDWANSLWSFSFHDFLSYDFGHVIEYLFLFIVG